MTSVATFTFNAFQENTYLLFDATKQCAIIDPGCYDAAEKEELAAFITANHLRPVLLLNTHAHIDHVLGNRFVAQQYGVPLGIHQEELGWLFAVPQYGYRYGFAAERSPEPSFFIQPNQPIAFGETVLMPLFTPGHSPASVSFYCAASSFVISGDVLFAGSIGRTDLPGGDFQTLLESIETQLFALDDAVKVYAGHGAPTTIGHERRHNPFFA